MSRGIVAIDAGNSRVRVALVKGPQDLPRPGCLDGAGGIDLPQLAMLGEFPTRDGAGRPDAAPVAEILAAHAGLPAVLVSVADGVADALRAVRPDLAVVSHRWALPYSLGVGEPSAVGADRLANVAAAVACGLQDALVVDAGTATTFDVLRGGTFVGGLIAPGMALGLAALRDAAPRLPGLDLRPVPLTPGRDTSSALAAGSWHTARLGVLATIDALLTEAGPCPVILTGGLGRLLGSDRFPHDRFWTLRGAAWLQHSGIS